MRTLKDPRKKPELRRRVDLEDFEEDARAIKSTPPKKRKTARSSKDDSSGLDDSGSYLDNHSDILSEKTSLMGDDDMSDVSLLKSTPPKKRDYSRAINKTPEQNGETHMEVKEITGKTAKGKKKGKSAESLKDCENDKRKVIEKPLSKGKQKIVKQTEGSELHDKQNLAVDEEKVETKKKVRGKKKNDTAKDTEAKIELPFKKNTARKRKLSGVSTCTTESNKDAEIEQMKTKMKSKEQISKEEEKNELKRQTEELRKTNSEKNNPHKSGDSPHKMINDMNNISEVFEKKFYSGVVSDNTSNEHERSDQIHKSVTREIEDIFTSVASGNGAGHCESENDDIESSDLDTSFESVNSGKKSSNNDDEHFLESENKEDTSARNGFIDEEPKQELKITCDLCGSVSRSKGGHTRHLRKCQPEKLGLTVVSAGAKPRLFSCEQCEYSAPKRVLVINHMRTHGIYQCKRCKFRADSDECLEEHSAHEHKDRSDCKFCKNCNRYVKCSEIPLEKHMEKCQGRVPFKCPECSKEFQYESSLKCHVVSHYPDQPKLFSCTQCDYKSNYKANLKKHIRLIHEQRGERNIKCPDCEKLFYTEDNMKRHQKLHSENRPFKCEKDECDKSFKTVNALKFHLISHQTDRPFPCEIEGCSKSFKSKRALGLHLNETHQNAPKNYSCTEDGCSMAFYKKSHFDRHMDAHKDNRTHFCAFVACTKAFRTAEALKVHCLVHTDEKPVKCEHCSYTCRQKSSVKFHMKKKHPELDLTSPKLSVAGNPTLTYSNLLGNKTEAEVDAVAATSEVTCNNKVIEGLKPNITDVDLKENSLVESTKDVILVKENGHVTKFCLPPSADSCNTETHNTHDPVEKLVLLSKMDDSAPSSESKPHSAEREMKESEILQQKVIETPPKKITRADMYEFQSEEDSGDEMKPGLLRREYDKDKPPLPPVDAYIRNNRKLPLLPVDVTVCSDRTLPTAEIKKQVFNDIDSSQIIRKKPGPKPKSVQEHSEFDTVVRQPKKRGRKKKCEIEKWADQESTDTNSPDKYKTGKRGRSPKVKRDGEHELDEESQEVPMKKKRGPKPKPKLKDEKAVEKTPKKRGRKKKVVNAEETEVVPENGDATINYSEVESGELFGDSKDSIPDHVEPVPDRTVETMSEKTLPQLNKSDNNGNKNDSDEASAFKVKLDRSEDRKSSESESSDIGSDFDEDLKPPPAPRPPPIYDSEDGDIESGPENEELNASAMSNEPLRDFESARETSREISRDFESSREIDDSVKTSEYINSVETIPSREPIGTPASVNPYKNDSVTNDPENPLSHHSSVPHTPSHNSVPATPVASQDLHDSRGPGERIVKNTVHGQTNDDNDTTDESSMPEVDKDYVGRFFEEIQCVQVPSEPQISRGSSIDESSKSQDQVIKAPHSDSGVPSSLGSNQTERSMQMQSPPTDLSHKRMNLMSPERVSEYHPRSESSHNRSSERIPSVPSYDTQYSPLDPYSSPLPPRETILRQTEPLKVPSSPNASSSYLRFPDGEAMLQRQRMTTPYDRSLQSLHRMAEAQLPQHNSSSPLLRHVPAREDMFPSAAGVAGSMSRNPIYSSWAGQDVRPSHWSHPAYLQQQTASASSSLFGKDSYLSGREFMFDPSRAAAERNMFSSLASSHNQRPDIAHDTFQFDRFDLGNYFASHGYNTAPSLPVDYTRSAHSSSQKSLDERYRQPVAGVTDFRSLPPAASTSDVFGMNSSFNLEKLYPRDSMYHAQHLSDNAGNPFLPGMAAQHPMFSRDYSHRGFYAQNPPYPFMNMTDKNYPMSTGKLGGAPDGVTSQRDLVSVPRPNMSVPDGQLQDPYRHHSSMIYNMMNKYF